ncbi:MAG TPA: transporter substrate-binding domain-containing protein [Sedimentibacter sp.]|nr:transporter substrate-binding domain-containing protein [Sedimentibacter sp.]HHZ00064.1 transporter substrate-binding domain-containing protein [Tissierellia bacterium]HRC81555.1 transporter substrate-binding domain-containing protein [Sedimentibacter sp.]
MSLKKKITKLITILLLTVIAAGLISGCTSNASNPAKTESSSRLDAIKERGYLEVVMEPYFAPFEFIDPSKEGQEQYVGSDVELAKYIADKFGVELRIVPLEFGAVLSSITEGKYDLAISALAYTPARAEAMNMSKGYYYPKDNPGYGLLIRKEDATVIKGPEDVKDKIIVAQSGSLQELLVNEQVPEYKEFKRVSATTDGFLMVQEKKADVCSVSIAMAQLYIDANPDAGLMIVEDFEFEVDESVSGTRIGITLGEDELTEEINKIIDEVVSAGLYEKWYMEYTEYAKQLGL